MANSGDLATALLISDDPATRASLRGVLEQAGYSVIQVEREEARACALERAVDVILLDLTDPEVAEETARQLKEACVAPFVPLLRLSAVEHEARPLAESLAPGAYALLGRPVSPQVLLSTMSTLVRLGRAYRELHHERTKLEEVLVQMPSGVIIADAEGRVQTTNERAAEILCLPEVPRAQEERVRTLRPARQGVLAGIERWPLWRALRTGERVIGEEFEITCGDGSKIVARVSAGPIRSPEGEIIAGVLTLTDITARKQTEEALRQLTAELEQRVAQRTAELRESEARLRLFTNDVPAAIAMLDTEMRYLAYSQRWLADYGLEGQNLHGRSHYEVFPEIPERWKEIHRRCLAGAVERSEGDPFERADGRVQWLRWEVHPWYQASGQVGGIVIASEDITAHKRAEEAVQRQAALLDLSYEPVLVWEFDGAVQFWNQGAESLYGYAREEAVGRVSHDLLRTVFPEGFARIREALLRDGTWAGELTHRARDGRRVTVDSRWQLVGEPSGRRVVLETNRDITARREAEVALRESEARYRSLFENMLEGLAYCRMLYEDGVPEDFVYLDVNDAFERLTGLKDVVGKRVSEVVPDLRERNPELFEVYGRVARTGVPERFETYVQPLENWFSVSVYSPAAEHFIAVFDNITPRKEAEEQRHLLESAERQRSFLASFIDNAATAMAYLDADLRFVRVNRVYAEWVGLPAERLVGRMHFGIWASAERVETMREVLVTGEPARRSEVSITYPPELNRPDGFIDYAVFPVKDELGRAIGLVLSAEDATERVRAREEVAAAAHARDEQAQLLEAILDNVHSGIAYLDSDLRYVHVNPMYERIVGRSREELLGHTVLDFVVDERGKELVRQARDTGEPLQREEFAYRFKGPPERAAYLSVTLAPIRDEQGRLSGLVLALVDVTEQVEARERMLSIERARAELAENLSREIAHRTKNNLTMAAGLLRFQTLEHPDARVSATLSDTVSRLMTFASIQDELQAATTTGWLDLLPLLRRVASASSGTFAGGEAVVSVTGESVALPSRAATSIAVVANEFITNALKHGAPGAGGKLRVDVEIEPTDGSLRLCVWNSGNPVPADFDPRAHGGMGLQLVASLVAEQYGGEFSLKPERGGTRAQAIVPLADLQRE
jgi:PAS domain S-box-containing protein